MNHGLWHSFWINHNNEVVYDYCTGRNSLRRDLSPIHSLRFISIPQEFSQWKYNCESRVNVSGSWERQTEIQIIGSDSDLDTGDKWIACVQQAMDTSNLMVAGVQIWTFGNYLNLNLSQLSESESDANSTHKCDVSHLNIHREMSIFLWDFHLTSNVFIHHFTSFSSCEFQNIIVPSSWY